MKHFIKLNIWDVIVYIKFVDFAEPGLSTNNTCSMAYFRIPSNTGKSSIFSCLLLSDNTLHCLGCNFRTINPTSNILPSAPITVYRFAFWVILSRYVWNSDILKGIIKHRCLVRKFLQY